MKKQPSSQNFQKARQLLDSLGSSVSKKVNKKNEDNIRKVLIRQFLEDTKLLIELREASKNKKITLKVNREIGSK